MNCRFTSFVEETIKLAAEGEGWSTGEKAMAGTGMFLGSNLVGGLAAQTIAPSLVKGIHPSKAKMGLKDVIKLKRELSPGTAVAGARHGGIESAMFIPKGGMLPKFMRPMEEELYGMRGVPRRAVKAGFERGVAVAPSLSKSPEFLAHELGHASLRDPSKSGRLVRTLVRARGAAIPLGLLAGSTMAVQDPDSLTAQLAPAAVAGGFVPALADEALASRRGMQAVRGLGKYSPKALSLMRGNLLRAFGTYGALAAGTTLPALAFTQWRARNAAKQ